MYIHDLTCRCDSQAHKNDRLHNAHALSNVAAVRGARAVPPAITSMPLPCLSEQGMSAHESGAMLLSSTRAVRTDTVERLLGEPGGVEPFEEPEDLPSFASGRVPSLALDAVLTRHGARHGCTGCT